MSNESEVDIGAMFKLGTPIDEAMSRAAIEAVRRHQHAGVPVVAWRDGKVVQIAAEDLLAELQRPV